MKPRRPTPLELRVLGGAQQGAKAALAPGGDCRVVGGGQALGWADVAAQGPDIVLNSLAGFALRVTVRDDAEEVTLTLLQGTARLAGVDLPLGQPQPWRWREPLTLGDVLLAVGPQEEAVWTPPPAAAAPAPASPPAAEAQRGAERWLLPMGVALVAICAGLLGMMELLTPAQAGVSAAAGQPLAAVQRQGALDQQRALAVVDVFRLHGINVKADVNGEGVVQVRAQERDAWRVTQAEQAARRDVPGLQALQVHNEVPAAPAGPRPPLTPDAGKRIVSVVDDAETPYFVTADGGRYFVGALLPSGHRVMQIADQAVTVERDGQMTRLSL